MGEWSTYSLSDFLMFSPRSYWRMVDGYLRELWPAHLVAYAAVLGAAMASRERPRLALLLLAGAWLWVAWAFFWERFAAINLAAPWIAAAFAAQAALLLLAAAWRPHAPPALGILVGVLGWPLAEPLALATWGLCWRRWWLCVIPSLSLVASAAMHCVMAGYCR
jgi:hypothetical protein